MFAGTHLALHANAESQNSHRGCGRVAQKKVVAAHAAQRWFDRRDNTRRRFYDPVDAR